jgi:hypothetical protein
VITEREQQYQSIFHILEKTNRAAGANMDRAGVGLNAERLVALGVSNLQVKQACNAWLGIPRNHTRGVQLFELLQILTGEPADPQSAKLRGAFIWEQVAAMGRNKPLAQVHKKLGHVDYMTVLAMGGWYNICTPQPGPKDDSDTRFEEQQKQRSLVALGETIRSSLRNEVALSGGALPLRLTDCAQVLFDTQNLPALSRILGSESYAKAFIGQSGQQQKGLAAPMSEQERRASNAARIAVKHMMGF